MTTKHSSNIQETVDMGQLTTTWSQAVQKGTLPQHTLKAISAEEQPVKVSVRLRPGQIFTKKQKNKAGDFELLKVIGKGGMGMVYTARQASIDREIAVKMIRSEYARDKNVQSRFIREAVVTGDLDHPNIVPIHELGKAQNGILFYVMKHVRGVPWHKVIGIQSIEENLDVLMKLCDAVAFTHDRGVVHRDLKPENVMLGDYGEVMLMDWGIAASFDVKGKAQRISDDTPSAGTPAYMSPEMALADNARIGPWSDTYLLGGILYEIIGGFPPHHGENVMNCIMNAAQNVIRPTEARGELLEIALKAMALEPEKRYKSVKTFQEAIRNYIKHAESITLYNSAQEELERAEETKDYNDYASALFSFKNALKIWPEFEDAKEGIREACFFYAKCAYEKKDYDLAESLLDPDDETHKELHAKSIKEKIARDSRLRRIRMLTYGVAVLAMGIIVVLTGAFFWIRAEKEKAVAAEKKAKIAQSNEARQRRKAERENYFNIIDLADKKLQDGLIDQAEELLERSPASYRGWEWGWLLQHCKTERLTLRGHSDIVESAAYSPDGTLVLTGSKDKTAILWDVQTGKKIFVFSNHSGEIYDVSFSPSGDRAITKTRDGMMKTWDIRTGEELVNLPATADNLKTVVYSPDGRYEVVRMLDDTVRIRDIASNRVVSELKGHTNYVRSVAFSPDGSLIVTGSLDNTAIVWEVETGRKMITLTGHSDGIRDVTFSPDGHSVMTGSLDHTAKIWDIRTEQGELILEGHRNFVTSADFAPDNRFIATGSNDNTVILWNLDTGGAVRSFTGHSKGVLCVAFAPDGKHIASGSHDETINIWDVETGDIVFTITGHSHSIYDVAYSRDGKFIVSASWDKTAKVWDADNGKEILTLEGHSAPVICVAVSPNGRLAATGSKDKTIIIWDLKTGNRVKTLKGHGHSVYDIAFLPNGKFLVSGSWDKTAKIWNLDTGAPVSSLRGHSDSLYAVAVSPDGRRILTGSWDKTTKIWDTETARELLTLTGHEDGVYTVGFSPDGLMEVSAGRDKNVIVRKSLARKGGDGKSE